MLDKEQEKIIKKELNKYMNNIKIPENLEEIIMEDMNKIKIDKYNANEFNEKKFNVKKVVGIAAAVVIVAGIVGSVGFKNGMFDTKNRTQIVAEKSSGQDSQNAGGEDPASLQDTSKIGGLYSYTEDVNIDNEKHTINYSLYLYPDGTFKYERSCFAPIGEIGKYAIDGNNLILNVQYKTNSSTELIQSNEVIKLTINIDGTITDKNKLTVPGLDSDKDYKDLDLENIEMIQAQDSEAQEYLKTYPNIQTIIDSADIKDNNNNDNTVGGLYTYQEDTNIDNIEGLYTYQGNTKIDTENYEFSYSLCLYADGTFKYERSCFAPVGELGKYTIEDNNLILKVDYETSSDTLTDPTIDVIKLKINDDGTITDKNKLTVPGLDSDKDLENIKMIKASESETKEYLKAYPNIQTIIDSSDIDYDNP